MDQFTADYLANLTAELSARLLEAAGRRAREAISGTDSQQAVERCVQAGVIALLTTSIAQAKDEVDLLADIFGQFFDDPDVARELSQLLRGKPLDIKELEDLFADAGFEAETLPSLDFEQGLAAFESAFLATAAQEPTLQGVMQTNQLLAQTALQREMLATMRDLAKFLQQTKPGSVGIQADHIVAENVVNGVQVNYQWIAQSPVTLESGPKPLPSGKALLSYLDNLLATHQYLRLQGIDAGNQPLTVLLEKIFVPLKALEMSSNAQSDFIVLGDISIGTALQNKRLVIIGDPGCGKSTLLSYMAITYAKAFPIGSRKDKQEAVMTRRKEERDAILRKAKQDNPDRREPELRKLPEVERKETKLAYSETRLRRLEDKARATPLRQVLQLEEYDYLPIHLPLRNFGRYITSLPDTGKSIIGPATLLEYLHNYYIGLRFPLSPTFFDPYLENGKAALLFDGMDEVANSETRQTIARLIEDFVRRFPKCRYVVTSREAGYQGSSRIGEQFSLAKVQDFNTDEVRRFVREWTQTVETALAEDTPEIRNRATEKANNLIDAIESRPNVATLAVNPLLLTVIALMYRTNNEKLPNRRYELFEESVKVLIEQWDKAKGLATALNISGNQLDAEEQRAILEKVALWIHEKRQRDIERDDLRQILLDTFKEMGLSKVRLDRASNAFLQAISERSGLFNERDIGRYGFVHQTFQEYLAARHLTEREDAIPFTLAVLSDPWWHEVVLFQSGYLSTQGKRRVSELIRAVINSSSEIESLLLAAECISDITPERIDGDLLQEVIARLNRLAEVSLDGTRETLMRKLTARNAAARIQTGRLTTNYWKRPWGEPEWITIPAGKFYMGRKEGLHEVDVPEFHIALTPITNAQYDISIRDTGVKPPDHWRGGQVARGQENHPVVNISGNEVIAYCLWLSHKLGKTITLPTETEWEKAARGNKDIREFPWGKWDNLNANTQELGIAETVPVGLLSNGASPYGVLDMSGNVWEWTRTSWNLDFPYLPPVVMDFLLQAEVPWRTHVLRQIQELPAFDSSYTTAFPKTTPDHHGRMKKVGIRDLQKEGPFVLRGGSYKTDSANARCSYRYWWSDLAFRIEDAGFRVVISSS